VLFLFFQAPVQFENESELLRVGRNIPIGTMVFVMNTESLYLRVSQGFRSIQVGSTGSFQDVQQ